MTWIGVSALVGAALCLVAVAAILVSIARQNCRGCGHHRLLHDEVTGCLRRVSSIEVCSCSGKGEKT